MICRRIQIAFLIGYQAIDIKIYSYRRLSFCLKVKWMKF